MSEKATNDIKEETVEQGGPKFDPPVYIQRYEAVRDALYKLPGIEKVIDFGCAEGKFIKYLKKLPFVVEIACIDLNEDCLEFSARCSRPLAWDYIYPRHQELKIKIFKGNVAEKDCRMQDFNAVTCIELIEHLKPEDLLLLPDNIFGYICPKVAIFTTPNSEFNILFPQLQGFRHWDHKFEWTRKEFKNWCDLIITNYPDYTVEIHGIGKPPEEFLHLGCCSQMAVFKLKDPLKRHISNQIISDKPYILIDENEYPGRVNENTKKLAQDLDDLSLDNSLDKNVNKNDKESS